MQEELIKRVVYEAEYIIKTGATLRRTAKVFHVGKSTVHKDMSKRLPFINKKLFRRVKDILNINLSERHIRGGEATKRKYLRIKTLDIKSQKS